MKNRHKKAPPFEGEAGLRDFFTDERYQAVSAWRVRSITACSGSALEY